MFKKKARIHTLGSNSFVVIDCETPQEAQEVKSFINSLKERFPEDMEEEKKPDIIMPGNILEDVEKQLILSVLKACNFNRTHAAKMLGCCIRTLRMKIKSYSKDDDTLIM